MHHFTPYVKDRDKECLMGQKLFLHLYGSGTGQLRVMRVRIMDRKKILCLLLPYTNCNFTMKPTMMKVLLILLFGVFLSWECRASSIRRKLPRGDPCSAGGCEWPWQHKKCPLDCDDGVGVLTQGPCRRCCECPGGEPVPNSECPCEGLTCKYGQECCRQIGETDCTDCSHSYQCDCFEGQYACLATDHCYRDPNVWESCIP